MKDQNIYRKMDNGRYKPYGVCYQPDNIPDGIWYVKHHEYSRGVTSIPYIAGLFRVGDAQEIDIPVLCGLEDMCNEITGSKEWSELLKKGYCLQDIVHLCVKKIYDKSKSNDKRADNK